jgi:hypothetical protein
MLMVLVAVVAVGIGGLAQCLRLRRLYLRYRDQTAHCEVMARYWSMNARWAEGVVKRSKQELADASESDNESDHSRLEKKNHIDSFTSSARLYRARVAHYAEMARKYRRAASRPWLPVAPDPPEPK